MARKEQSIFAGFARGLSSRLKEERELERLLAERRIRSEQDRISRESREGIAEASVGEQRRQFDITETRKEKEGTQAQERNLFKNIAELLRLDKSQQPKRTTLLDPTGQPTGTVEGDIRFLPKATTPKESSQERIEREIITKGLQAPTSENIDVLNLLLERKGLPFTLQQESRGISNLFGLAGRDIQPVPIPGAIQPGLDPGVIQPTTGQLQPATDAQVQEAFLKANGDVNLARQLLAEQGLTD